MYRSQDADFHILDELGRGTSGIVYKVQRHVDGKQYALKRIPLDTMDATEIQRVVAEVQLMAQTSSPYIVQYFDSYVENQHLNIVMELCETCLHTQIKRQAAHGKHFSETQIWVWAIQALRALEALHRNNIVHRDIKSMNLLIASNGALKVGDFGVAKLMSTRQCLRTKIGTPYYLSPELCEDRPYNSKTDIWSLGVVLHELSTLSLPFRANSEAALVLKIIRSQIPSIPKHYSASLSSLISLCLRRKPEQRPIAEQLLRLKQISSKVPQLL